MNCTLQHISWQKSTYAATQLMMLLKTDSTCQGHWPHTENILKSHIWVKTKPQRTATLASNSNRSDDSGTQHPVTSISASLGNEKELAKNCQYLPRLKDVKRKRRKRIKEEEKEVRKKRRRRGGGGVTHCSCHLSTSNLPWTSLIHSLVNRLQSSPLAAAAAAAGASLQQPYLPVTPGVTALSGEP